jgi:AcrR family transcriptional regulator
LDAITELAGTQGYARLTVQRVIDLAGVSRATFYQYFLNVEDCFLTAYRHHAARLVAEVASARGAGAHHELGVLRRMVAFAESSPAVALLLAREGLAAGPRGILERDALISNVGAALARSHEQEPSVIDLPAAILVGGVLRFLTLQFSGDRRTDGLADGVLVWARAFVRPSEQRAWSRTFEPPPPRSLPSPPPRPTTSRPRGPTRERIIQATAASIREKGYAAVTVADIVATGRISRRAFYNQFASKPDAYIASYEYAFQQTLAACTPAFFSAREWPERVWAGAHAFTAFFAREPLLAHLGFVESYSLGPDFLSRAHDTQMAFTLFLEDGYRERPEAERLPRACSPLTMASIFETAFHASRWGAALHMRRMQPLAVYLALTPFIGSDEAGRFVTGKLAAGGP